MKSRSAKKEAPAETFQKKNLLTAAGRVVLWLLLIFAGFLAITAGGAALYLTPKRIEAFVKPQIAKQTGGHFDFTLARFNPFKGLLLRNISLSLDSNQTHLPLRLFTAREALFDYSFKQLLRRRLVIEEIYLEEPVIHLSLSVSEKPQLTESQADTTAAALPLDVQLKLLRLTNASIRVEAKDSAVTHRIFIGEINLFINDLSAARGNVLLPENNIRGGLAVQLDHSPLAYLQRTNTDSISIDGRLDASLALLISDLSHVSLRGKANFSETTLALNGKRLLDTRGKFLPISLMTSLQLDVFRQQLHIDSLSLAVQEVPWIGLSISADSLMSVPTITGRLLYGAVPLRQLVDITSMILPKEMLPDIFLHNPAAAISVDRLDFSAAFPEQKADLQWNAAFSLKNAGATVDKGKFFLGGLNFSAILEGRVEEQKIAQAAFQLEAAYDSAAAAMPAMFFTGPLAFSAIGTLDRDGFPINARAELAARNVLGANLQGNIDLMAPQDLRRIRGKALLRLENFDISQLPEAQWLGELTAETILQINSLDSLKATLKITTDTLAAVQQGQLYILEPLAVNSAAAGSFHLKDNRLEIRGLDLFVDRILRGKLRGTFSLADSSIVVTQCSLELDHAGLWEKLPAALKDQLPGAKMTGRTALQASGRMHLSRELLPSEFEAEANLQIMNDLLLPVQNLKVNRLYADAEFRADSRSGGYMQFAVSVDTTTLFLPNPLTFHNNRLLIRLSVPNLETVRLDTGYVSLPDLQTFGAVSGQIENLLTHPLLVLRASLRQAAEDTLIFAPEVFFKGINTIELSVRADSSRALLEAAVQTKDLSLFLPNDVRIDRLNADLSFVQEIDLLNPSRFKPTPAVVRTPSDGLMDYLLYRPYYHRYPNKSRLTIRKIGVGQFMVENIAADIYLGNGRLEIPYFALDAYGGNIAGQFSLAAGEHDPLDASYKLTAHLSAINSSLLLPSAGGAGQSNITAHAELRGRGLNIQKGIDLDGYFNISEIESRVADNLLRSLDPEGKDSGIRSTRLLINRGFKPKLFRFEIRHGFCYPAVYFKQPWYFPVRLIGGGIDLSRIPLVSLLKLNPKFSRSFK